MHHNTPRVECLVGICSNTLCHFALNLFAYSGELSHFGDLLKIGGLFRTLREYLNIVFRTFRANTHKGDFLMVCFTMCSLVLSCSQVFDLTNNKPFYNAHLLVIRIESCFLKGDKIHFCPKDNYHLQIPK